jgi:predicted phage tail protein
VPAARTAEQADNATSAANATNAVNAVNAVSAQTAQSAQTATSANTAQTITGKISASQVSGSVANAVDAERPECADGTDRDGDQFVNISVSSSSASDTTLHAIAGLTLSMRCTGGDADIDATTSVSSASCGMSAVANGVATSFVKAEGSFNTGATITSTIAAPSHLSFSYEGGGKVASGTLTVYDNAGTCSAFGVAEYS